MKHPKQFFFNKLKEIIELIEEGTETNAIIEQILNTRDLLKNKEGGEDIVLVDAFLEAMHNRVTRNDDKQEHIYLKAFETPQIMLFENLIQKLSFVSLAQKTINNFIATKVKGFKSITIMDIGIGTGLQMVSILDQIRRTSSEIEEINVVGIEPSIQSLDITEKNIEEYDSGSVKINLIKVEGFAEELDYADIMSQVPDSSEYFVINASFALHHIPQKAKRQDLLNKLKEIKPDVFLLSEPNVDHYCPDLKQRFQNCFGHFKVNFELIDGEEITDAEKFALKNFFCREIKDIVGNDDSTRVERHSPASYWVNALEEARFDFMEIPYVETKALDFHQSEDGYLGLMGENETVVGLFAAC